jgi:hypothetical protein
MRDHVPLQRADGFEGAHNTASLILLALVEQPQPALPVHALWSTRERIQQASISSQAAP